MSHSSKLVVGLGNPGNSYARNRHNAGFLFLDSVLETRGLSPSWKKKFEGLFQSVDIEGCAFSLLKPQTMMNLSGKSVARALRYGNFTPDETVVIHDDLDLPFGKIKVKQGGGHGGHNGLRSITDHIGKDFYRIRIGIGRPVSKDQVSPYVLSNFTPEEHLQIRSLFEKTAAYFADMCTLEKAGRVLSRLAATQTPP